MSRRKLSPEPSENAEENVKIQTPDIPESFTSVVAAHYNTIKEKGLDERSKSRIVYLRNFNNWIKSMLINEYLNKYRAERGETCPINVLDIGCGKGGDLLKWKINGISHLVCVDLAELSIEQCEQRYKDMKSRMSQSNQSDAFSAEFIVADCTKVRLKERFQKADISLDIVSCQFSFHYCFESLPQAECMLRNISESLRPGGFFIGSIPDSNDIVMRLRKAGNSSFGNDVFRIQFAGDIHQPFPLFGAKYEFFLEEVVNCPEFLVHFGTLIRLAETFGLKFISKERFQDYYLRMKEEGRQILGRMQAMETYPPFENVPLLGKLSEYSHADLHLQENSTSHRVGTLSRSEWEAAALYCVFAFQKVEKEEKS